MLTSGPFGLADLDDALAGRLGSGLDRIETLLRASVRSEYPFVTETARHLVDAGGKRFRPLVVLMAAQFGDPADEAVIKAGVVVELTHLATLYHDDVMDEAAMRRGAASANARWDNSVAILAGDFLFARASELLADLGPEAVRIHAQTFARLVTGQIEETVGPGERDAVTHYLKVVADKTGSLIATSGQYGAMFSGADPEVVDVMTRFGEEIGIAFQLADDVLDVASESFQSGKTPGTDLREGVRTLPVLHALASDDPEGEELRELLTGDLADDARHARALKLLRQSPAMDAARHDLRQYADQARAVLQPLPAGPAKDALLGVCALVVERSG